MKFVLYLIEHQTIHLKKLFKESLDSLCNDLKNLCNKDQFIWLMSDECETGNICKLFLQLFSTEKSLVFHWDCNRFTSYVNISYPLEIISFCMCVCIVVFFLLFFWYKILPLYAQKGSEFGKMKLSYFIWTCTYSGYVHITMQE